MDGSPLIPKENGNILIFMLSSKINGNTLLPMEKVNISKS